MAGVKSIPVTLDCALPQEKEKSLNRATSTMSVDQRIGSRRHLTNTTPMAGATEQTAKFVKGTEKRGNTTSLLKGHGRNILSVMIWEFAIRNEKTKSDFPVESTTYVGRTAGSKRPFSNMTPTGEPAMTTERSMREKSSAQTCMYATTVCSESQTNWKSR